MGLSVGGSAALAQEQGGIAIIDMSAIFKQHTGFKTLTTRMRSEVEAAEAELKERRNALNGRVKQLSEMEKGSPGYKELEEELTKANADLQADVALKKKDFLNQEAKIYYDVYREILDSVTRVAQKNRIDLVLRFNGDAIDPNDPQSVLKELNKTVVYYDRAIDITEITLEEVNRSGPPKKNSSNTSQRQSVPKRTR
jgi:Skp family chaperone for outer membrane proteins